MKKWVRDEQKPDVYYPITEDMQVIVGLAYVTNGTPPGEIVGSVLYSGKECRVALYRGGGRNSNGHCR